MYCEHAMMILKVKIGLNHSLFDLLADILLRAIKAPTFCLIIASRERSEPLGSRLIST